MADQLLVSVDDPRLLDDARAFVETATADVFGEADPDDGRDSDLERPFETEISTLVFLPRGTDPFDVREVAAQLQQPGVSVSFNHISYPQPNNGFRPYDDPQPLDAAPGETVGNPTEAAILVVDSPPWAGSDFDVDGNGLVDEDHGHGEFVQSLIRQFRGGESTLVGVEPADVDAGSRWSPMGFSDADVLVALASVPSGSYRVVNLSLGGASCATPERPGDLYDARLALARGLRALAPEAVFVAAAGNTGTDQFHFPAAWRSAEAVDGVLTWASASASDPAVVEEINEIFDHFQNSLYAVGSVDPVAGGEIDPDDPTSYIRSSYSNCGLWINAVAPGTAQRGLYPDLNAGDGTYLWAAWSGTSFATARVSAALAGGITDGVIFQDGVLPC